MHTLYPFFDSITIRGSMGIVLVAFSLACRSGVWFLLLVAGSLLVGGLLLWWSMFPVCNSIKEMNTQAVPPSSWLQQAPDMSN